MKTVLALLLLSSVAFAHHDSKKSLHHDNNKKIETLSERIGEKPTAQLYTYRAILYFEQGKMSLAKHDLEHALMLDKDYQPAKNLLKKIK